MLSCASVLPSIDVMEMSSLALRVERMKLWLMTYNRI
jgi:hypothetical protein